MIIMMRNNFNITQISPKKGEKRKEVLFHQLTTPFSTITTKQEVTPNTSYNNIDINNNINNLVNKNGKLSKNYWKDKENQKEFMDRLYKHLNLTSLDDWQRVSVKTFTEKGGKTLLSRYYNYSFRKLLKSIYPNYHWYFYNEKKKESGYWSSLHTQRDFIISLVEKFNLKSIEEMEFVRIQKIKEEGGGSLLTMYQSNLKYLLFSLFPEVNWKFKSSFLPSSSVLSHDQVDQKNEIDISNCQSILHNNINNDNDNNNINDSNDENINVKDNNNNNNNNNNNGKNGERKKKDKKRKSPTKIQTNEEWKSIEFQRKFMGGLFVKLNYKLEEDWNKITLNDIDQHGGEKLVKIYRCNIFSLFSSIYPSLNIKKMMNKPKGFWKIAENRRSFMDNLFITLKLKSISDWKKVSLHQLRINGGHSLICYYNYSYSDLLSSIYPEENWSFFHRKKEQTHWNVLKNQQIFMDYLFSYYNYKTFDDWKNFTIKKIREKAGRGLVKVYKNKSLAVILSTIYPNYPIDEWPRSHLYVYRKKTLLRLQSEHLIEKKQDWYRVSVNKPLVMMRMLINLHPFETWNKTSFVSKLKKSQQRLLLISLKRIFPNSLIIEDYYHPYLSSSLTSYILELDIYLPQYNLAIEYQGEQHYLDMIKNGFSQLENYLVNDEEKRKRCKDINIALVAVPFWWDFSLPSFYALLKTQFPKF